MTEVITELGIIGALEAEVTLLKEHMADMKTTEIAGVTYYHGELLELPVVVAQCGVGKMNAAICSQAMISHFKVKRLVNVGVAGGLVDGMSIGDVVISEAVVHHDLDPNIYNMESPYNKGDEKWAGFFLADSWLIEKSKEACEANEFNRIYQGNIASGDWFIEDSVTKEEIKERCQALCSEMEGAAIGQVAAANNIPFIVIRTISDLADEGATGNFEEFLEETADKGAKVIKSLVLSIKAEDN